MFQRIVVPLDGSTRAEQALPVAARIARATHGSVILTQVVAHAVDFSWQYTEAPLGMPAMLETALGEVRSYLHHLALSDTLRGVPTIIEVVEGIPAEGILAVVDTRRADSIILCSHGSTGLKRWIMGSVARRVARHSPVPVLILREGEAKLINDQAPVLRPVRVMVALDGSSLAEAALAPAATLSLALSAPLDGEVHLARVLPLHTQDEASTAENIPIAQGIDMAAATTYLSAVQQRMRGQEEGKSHLIVTASVVVDPDIAHALLATAQGSETGKGVSGKPRYDVLAIATHGRTGLERWVLGSMAERVLGASRLPLLIVRAPLSSAKREEDKATVAQEEKQHESWVGLL